MTSKPSFSSGERHPYRWAILAGVWLAYYCFGLTTISLAPLVGVIVRELGMSHGQMGSILGAWQLVYIVTAVPCGLLLDRIGARRALALAFAIIALSGVLRSLAGGHATLFLAVALFGFGGPLISVGAPKVISLWFEGKERGLAMGIYITGPASGSMTVLALTHSVMMPVFADDWRAVLLAYAGFALASGLVWLMITAHPSARGQEAQLAAEVREPHLRVFAELIRIPAVMVLLIMSIGIFFFTHGMGNWLPEILRSHGMDATSAGFWASIPTLVGVISALVVPRLAVPSRRLAVLLGLFVSAGTASILLNGVEGMPPIVGLVAQGIAYGPLMTVAILTLIEIPVVGPKRAGIAGGMFFAAAEIGGVLGPVSIGVISDLAGDFDLALVTVSSICAVLILLLGVLRHLMRSMASVPKTV